MADRVQAWRSPIQLTLLVALSVFATETASMFTVHLVEPSAPLWIEVLLDASVLLVLVSPALFVLVFRPLTSRIEAQERTETELRRAEEALTERALASDEALAAVFQASPVPLVVLTPDGNIAEWNPAAQAVFGWRAEEVVGRPYPLVPPGHEAEFRELLARALRGERLPGIEVRRQRKDGALLDVTVWTAPLHDTAGAVTGILGVVADVTERKHDWERLRLQGAALEAAANAIVITDSGGDIVWANPAFTALTGYALDECRGRNMRILKSGRHDDAFYADLWRTVLSGEVWQREMVNRRKDGTLYIEDQTITPVYCQRHVITHFIDVKIDITERKRAEAALRSAEARYRALFEQSPDGVLLLDAETGKTIEANEAASKQLGYTREEFAALRISDYEAIETPEETQRHIQKVVAEGSDDFETLHRTRNGEIRNVHVWIKALQLGERLAFHCIFEDITDRKHAEAALRASEELHRVLAESASDAILIVDVVGQTPRVSFVNRAAERIFGYSQAELLDAELTMLMPADLRQKHLVGLARYLETGERRISWTGTEFRARHKTGREFPVEMSYGELRRGGGHRSFVGIVRDITERKQLEAQLQQSQKLEAVGQLAGGIAHDFNNMLFAISAFGELALRELGPEHPVLPRVRQMLKGAERAAGLTKQLLAFSRKQVLLPKPIDLSAVVRNMETMLGRLLGEDIDFAVSTASDLAIVVADPGQIEQVLLNLAVNARDAMPKGGRLTIETKNADLDESYCAGHPLLRPGRYVMVGVSDTGIGMDAATQARIFEPFFTTKPEGEGTGLGLATVYGIVKQSGGYIWVYSEPGQGTTFKVYLPRVDEPASAEGAASANVRPARGHESVLLVEDLEIVREAIHEMLERSGYAVLPASNGEEALAVAREHVGPIDLLLTDVVMPKLGGADLAARVRAPRPGIRVLCMSGYPKGWISQRGGLGAGIALLEKPFTEEQLLIAVREALDRPMHEVGE